MSTTHHSPELADIGEGSLSSIRDLVAGLDRDTALAAWAATLSAEECIDVLAASGADVSPDTVEELRDRVAELDYDYTLEEHGFDFDPDGALEAIWDDCLCAEVRSGWSSPGDPLEPCEFALLLSTGGPAVRIRGELDGGEPCRAWLEVQDWGTPWTEHITTGSDNAALLLYAQQFNFSR